MNEAFVIAVVRTAASRRTGRLSVRHPADPSARGGRYGRKTTYEGGGTANGTLAERL